MDKKVANDTDELIVKLLELNLTSTQLKVYLTIFYTAHFEEYCPNRKKELMKLLKCSNKQVSIILGKLQGMDLIKRTIKIDSDGKQKIILRLINPI